MGLPTLKELGLTDKRNKIPEAVKNSIKAEIDNGVTNMAYLSRKYKVSVGTIRYIKDPVYIKNMIKKSRKQHSYNYYNKEKQDKFMKDLRIRKEDKIKVILREYKKLKEEEK